MITEKEMAEFDEHDSMLPEFDVDDTDLISEPEGKAENVEDIDMTKLDAETKEALGIEDEEETDVIDE